MKKYVFNGQTYTDLDLLINDFINNFNIALEELFIKPKKFVSFVKSFDKEKAKKVVEIFESTKYKGNVLSFIIFSLAKDPIVLINGVNLDFNDFIKVISLNRENKAIKAFMEDNGMSKTYATMNIDKKIPNDSFYIEKTYEDDFTYNYIANYLKIDYTENLNGFISNILINDDERFRRACEVIKSDDFQMVLAHKTNFKAAYNIRYNANPIFEAIKMLSIEYKKEDLSKIIDDTFYWWLLDNFDKYIYSKKETLALKNKLKKLKKENQKDLTFEEHIELSKNLYEIYLQFAEGYSKKEICVNEKKYNVDQYALDKHYCKTLICVDYMKNHPVKLTTEKELKIEAIEKNQKEDIKENIINNNDSKQIEKIDEEIDKNLEVIKDEKPTKKELKISEKIHKKIPGMNKFIVVTTIIDAIIIALIYFIFPMLPENIFGLDLTKFLKLYEDNQNELMLITYISIGILIANLILIAVINLRNSSSLKAINLFYKSESIGKKETNLSHEDQKSIKNFEKNKLNIYKKIKRRERIITSIALALAGIIYSSLIIIISYIFKDEIKQSIVYLSLGISFGVGILWGILFKKKGAFSAFVVNALTIIITLALLWII